MNTRSSTAGRKCPMTVDCSSQCSENHAIVSGRQTKLKNAKSKEITKLENESKRKPRVDSVDEDEPKRKLARQDKNYNNKDDLTCGVTTRSTVRPGKRTRTQTPERSLSVTPESSKSGNKILETGRTRKKRQWESWAPYEKDCFFEALNEHSKDFDKIQIYLKKRRSDPSAAVRNKDQVRHFYYRTLNKITKYIPEPADPSDAKKTNHEVRSLICYGELRKKFRSLKEKDGKKLTELISTGKTTFRHHGRNVNIRAPTCRALKKLNANVSEEQEQVPQKIMIELMPSDNETWSMIQALAHNPRLRTTVSTRKTVASLIAYLLSKWKLQDSIDISLSPYVSQSGAKQTGKESEVISKVKQACDVKQPIVANSGVTNAERVMSIESGKDKVNKSPSTGKNETTSCVKTSSSTNHATAQDENQADKKDKGENCRIKDALKQENWNKSNSGNLTVADIFRRMNNPRKILLSYTASRDKPSSETNQALQQLVKLAAGEFSLNSKKDVANITSSKSKGVAKDTVTASRPSKVTKPKSTPKLQKPLAPKPPQEVIIPTVVSPSVINQVSINSTSKSGNHLTFGFTPINTFSRPSPIVPKTKKRQAARVVVQRTLLPRPPPTVVGPAGESVSPVSFVPSPFLNQNGLVNTGPVNKPRTILPTESTFPTGQPNVNATQSLPAVNLSVDSLIKLAMGQDIPENLEGLILPKSLNIERTPSERGHVRTEEIDSGIAPRHAEKTVKLVQSLNDAEKHLESAKQDVVEQSVDLLDNLKSSEDEDPFKFLSPSHIPSFPPEGWLNEESTDFSLGTLFSQFDSSPVKQKPSSVLDTPKKAGAASDSDSKDSHATPMFCDMMDENSVDYVKKFRDLAKKIGNDQESSSSDNVDSGPSSTISFKSLLSEASKE